MDSQVARNELRDLVARELVVQRGSHRWTRYELAAGLVPEADEAPPTSRRADRRQQLLSALGSGAVSRADLVRQTGLTAPTVTRWLRILRAEGLVESTEKSTKTPAVQYRRTAKVELDEGGTGGDP